MPVLLSMQLLSQLLSIMQSRTVSTVQYGGAESGGPGQQLCAVSIRFFHPFLKKWLEIRSKQDVLLDFPDGMVV